MNINYFAKVCHWAGSRAIKSDLVPLICWTLRGTRRELRAAAPIVVFRGEFVRVSWWITNDCRYCEKYSLSRHFVTCPSTDHSPYSPDRSLLYYRRHTLPYLSLWHFSCNWIIHLQHPVIIKNTAENIFQHSFIKSTNRKEGRKSKEIYF